MQMTAFEINRQLLDIIKSIKPAYEQSVADEIHYSEECTDLVHALELLKLSPSKREELSLQLSETRWKRRKAKENKEQLEPLVEVMKKQNGLTGGLSKAIEEIQMIMKTQSVRVYRPRVRTDLGEAFEHRTREEESAPKTGTTYFRQKRRVRCRTM
jgi:hypothetical protein